ncbi:MAG: hypothetical protein KDK12_16295 [Rhodobacteraceae bacterium]|nr:hypothetical protein [Paracoccaceae bacterium]
METAGAAEAGPGGDKARDGAPTRALHPAGGAVQATATGTPGRGAA